MARLRWRMCATIVAANCLLYFSALAEAQSRRAYSGEGPNKITHTDIAAGQMIDALLDPNSPRPTASKKTRQKKSRSARRSATRKKALRGKLVNNPDTEDGTSEFVLIDRYGGVLRYVEPVDNVDLEAHLGETVAVRRDTGDILLASQLAFLDNGGGKGDVQLVDYEEELIAPGEEFVESGPIYLDEGYHDGGLDFGGCPNCGTQTCQNGACGSRGVLYLRGEYLLWWLEGMNTPPLVVRDDDPNFGSAEIIYGDTRVLEDLRQGGRVTLGFWFDDCGKTAIEFDYLGLEDLDERFVAGVRDDAAPTDYNIGRPIFNPFDTGMLPRGRAVEDVDTNQLDGTVTVDVHSEFSTFGIRFRHGLCCVSGCNTGCGDCVSCGAGVGCGSGCGAGIGYPNGPLRRIGRLLRSGTRRTDFLWGFRWAELNEGIHIHEDLEELPPPGTEILVNDNFDTENEFVGAEIGYLWEWQRCRWSLEMLSKLAIGNTRQRVDISGYTINTDVGQTEPLPPSVGGLLALPTNIGTYERDEFSMIPEIGFTLGYQLTCRLKLTAGYTLLYWSNVVRPGDQIDLDVNVTQIPNNNGQPQVVPGDHPRFDFHQTDLWAQGINLGGEYRW